MFCIAVATLQYWYKNFLSNYVSDTDNKVWPAQTIESVSKSTGAVSEKPVYVLKKENLGKNMSIDDKAIGHDGFTIFSNHDTGKIAMMIESTTAKEVEEALEHFGDDLKQVENISMDMSATYSLVADNQMPNAKQVIDKFHVMKYVYDAVKEVRNTIRKEIAGSLSKGKKKTEEDKKKLAELDLIKRVRHAITKSPDKWNVEMKKTISTVFAKHDRLKTAYQISQNFKLWYDYPNKIKPKSAIQKSLYKWYYQASEVKEFNSVIKMIRKHEDEIINYFFCNGMSNARAERLNGKIERFVSNNYGVKNKDFILFRLAGYFS